MQSRVPCYDNQRCLRYIPNPRAARCWEEVARIQQQSCGDWDPKAKSNSHWDHERDLRSNMEWNIMKQSTYCQKKSQISCRTYWNRMMEASCESRWNRCHFLIRNHNQSDSKSMRFYLFFLQHLPRGRNPCSDEANQKIQHHADQRDAWEEVVERWDLSMLSRRCCFFMMWEWMTVFGLHRPQSQARNLFQVEVLFSSLALLLGIIHESWTMMQIGKVWWQISGPQKTLTSHVMSTWQIPRNSRNSRTQPDCWRVVLKALLVSPPEHIVQRLRGFQTSLSFASRENGDLLRSRTLPRIEHPKMSGRQWDFCCKSLFAGSETSEIGRVSVHQKGLNALGNHQYIYIYVFLFIYIYIASPLRKPTLCLDACVPEGRFLLIYL